MKKFVLAAMIAGVLVFACETVDREFSHRPRQKAEPEKTQTHKDEHAHPSGKGKGKAKGKKQKCVVKVTIGRKIIYCEPGPMSCEGAVNQCRKRYPNAKSFECMPGCK